VEQPELPPEQERQNADDDEGDDERRSNCWNPGRQRRLVPAHVVAIRKTHTPAIALSKPRLDPGRVNHGSQP
jgi:hypothetical protein